MSAEPSREIPRLLELISHKGCHSTSRPTNRGQQIHVGKLDT